MSRHEQPNEAELAQRVRKTFDEHEVSEEVQQALRHARAKAVELAEQTSVNTSYFRVNGLLSGQARWLVPVGALSVIGVAWMLSDNATAPSMPMLEEQELAAANELELLEDIEFIAWMMEQASPSAPDDS